MVTPAQACGATTRPGGPESLEPAWSKSGLAYVTARDLGVDTAVGAKAFGAWLATRTLWLAPPGKAAVRLAYAGSGVHDPVWSADGTTLMVVRGSRAYLLEPAARHIVEVAAGLTPDLYPMGYFGQLDYGQVLAWYSGRA